MATGDSDGQFRTHTVRQKLNSHLQLADFSCSFVQVCFSDWNLNGRYSPAFGEVAVNPGKTVFRQLFQFISRGFPHLSVFKMPGNRRLSLSEAA
jgi:hypothetical protein